MATQVMVYGGPATCMSHPWWEFQQEMPIWLCAPKAPLGAMETFEMLKIGSPRAATTWIQLDRLPATVSCSSSGREASMSVKREGIEYSGTPSALAELFASMSLKDRSKKKEDKPEDEPPDRPRKGKSEAPGNAIRQCRAIRANGERCRYTSERTYLDANELCRCHRRWIELGRPLA